MRKILALLITILVITSCKKTETVALGPTKDVSDILITTTLPLEKKSTPFFAGVRYQKNYQDVDQVSLSISGQEGVIVKTTSDFTGHYVLFSFAGIAQTGSTKFKLSIKNNQKTFQKETDYKIVDDLSIKTVWNNLSASYLIGLDAELSRYSDDTFWILKQTVALRNTANGWVPDPRLPILTGYFTDDFTNPTQKQTPSIFIPGLEGSYLLSYSGETLSELKIFHFDYITSKTYQPQKFYSELESVFGPYKSRTQTANEVITDYSNSEFSIITHYIINYQIYTIVKKK